MPKPQNQQPKPLLETESLILKIEARRTAHQQEHYVGAGVSPYRFLNLSMPQVREFAKTEFSFTCDNLSAWKGWDQIWQKTNIYDLLAAAVVWASAQKPEDQWQNRQILFGWADKANNWALADGMCSIYAHLFEAHPQEVRQVLETWSRSRNPWHQRMSVVSLFYYSRSRKHLPSYSFAQKLILRQLASDHYYVQKGVGWALRECWNVYPEKTSALLRKISAKIPPAAWTSATEKLSKKEKAELAEIRKVREARASSEREKPRRTRKNKN